MKKIVYAVLATITGLVLLFSYRTSHDATMQAQAPADTGGSSQTGTAGSSSTGSSSTGSSSGGSTGSSSSSNSGLADGTFTGSTAGTPFGPLQVQITVSGGRITDVQVPQYPSGNSRDRQINQRALPMLISETTSAQSAQIHMVSGATYTSEGYLSSLQSAIDQAHG